MLEKRAFYINGEWVESQGGTDHHVINPSTEEPCATITLGTQPMPMLRWRQQKLPFRRGWRHLLKNGSQWCPNSVISMQNAQKS